MKNNQGSIIADLVIDNNLNFTSNISTALEYAEIEINTVNEIIEEKEQTIKNLTPECDKLDYLLATSIGALGGLLDVFLVGKPGESPLGDITDKWFENRTKDFAKMCGWNGNAESLPSALRYLEKKFKIPYDQTSVAGAAKEVFGLSTKNHHFKSLGHNPNLLGLFFSILDQFNNTSHFVSTGESLSLEDADDNFKLQGNDIPSKILCGFVNWFGHLISDMSGSSDSKGRGMGLPTHLWSWSNDIIAIKKKLNIPVSEFNKSFNEMALEIYKEGYDARFQSTQLIPVFINEMIVRLFYSTRRLIQYFKNTPKENRNFKLLWKSCEPFSNTTIKRMLTVAHGTFCLVDTVDAVARGFIAGGGTFNPEEFFMRLNLPGIGRFTISLYGETYREIGLYEAKEEVYFFIREKVIIEDYIVGLNQLADIYDDKQLLTFVDDLRHSDMYKIAFEKTVVLTQKRSVNDTDILKTKADIDAYFNGGNN